MLKFLSVFIGGGIGSVLRYGVKIFFDNKFNPLFPYSTFVVNVLGSLILGFAVGYFMDKYDVNDELKLLITIGIAGGFTTFSTFSLDCFSMLKNSQLGLAMVYITASVLIGIIATASGYILSQKIS